MAPTSSTQHSVARLRALLRASPLIAPELRAHWLRVLPHLSAEQRAELAALLASDAAAPAGPPDSHATQPPAPPDTHAAARSTSQHVTGPALAAPSRADARRP